METPKQPVALVYSNMNGTKTRQNVAQFAELRAELEGRTERGEQTFAFEHEVHDTHKADLDTIMAGGKVPACKAVYA